MTCQLRTSSAPRPRRASTRSRSSSRRSASTAITPRAELKAASGYALTAAAADLARQGEEARKVGGTIHTIQGREADTVILVLGGNPGRPGARRWPAQNWCSSTHTRNGLPASLIGMHVWEVERSWDSRPEDSEAAKKLHESEHSDCVYTSVLVERSADLLGIDPGGRLRVACVEALDGETFMQRVELLEFADGIVRGRGVPLGEPVSPHLQRALNEETDYLGAAMPDGGALLCDVTNFVVLLCTPELELGDEFLRAPKPRDPELEDAHWRGDVQITDPNRSTDLWVKRCYSCGAEDSEPRYGELLPGSDTCVVIASIGGDPSPSLRHYAEIMGGAVVAVRTESDIAALVAACRERHAAVMRAMDERVAEHEEWRRRNADALRLIKEQASAEPIASTYPEMPAPSYGELEETEEEREAREASIEAAIEAWGDWEPEPSDFVDVAVYLERSSAALAADPTGTLRTHAVDALDQHEFGIGQHLYSFGHGLIAEGHSVINQRMGGYARTLLRHSLDHTRVDLPAAIRQAERLTGPLLIAVLGSELAEVPDELNAGVDAICPGTTPDDPINHRPPEPYGETVVFGLLGAEPNAELRARCEATGGTALAIRSAADLQAFAEACAAVYRDMVETVEAHCVSGRLDLDRVYGG